MLFENPAGLCTVDLTGDELLIMLEENLERTFAADSYDQMGGYIKRGLGLTVYLKMRTQTANASSRRWKE